MAGRRSLREEEKLVSSLHTKLLLFILNTAEKRILKNPVFDQDNRYDLTNEEHYTRATEKLIESIKLNLCDLFEKLYLMRYVCRPKLLINFSYACVL